MERVLQEFHRSCYHLICELKEREFMCLTQSCRLISVGSDIFLTKSAWTTILIQIVQFPKKRMTNCDTITAYIGWCDGTTRLKQIVRLVKKLFSEKKDEEVHVRLCIFINSNSIEF